MCVECLFLRSPSRVPYRTELLPRAPNGGVPGPPTRSPGPRHRSCPGHNLPRSRSPGVVVITAVPFYTAVRMGLQFSTAYEKEPTIYFGTTKTHLIVHRYRKTMHLIVVANCLSKRIDFARLFPNLLVGSETRFQDGTKKLAYDPARNPRFDLKDTV